MKKLTWALSLLVIVCFALVVWICFFQFPSVDDYMGTYYEKKYGMGGSIKWYLSNMNGRFTSIPVFLWISSSRILLSQYAWLLLFFLTFTYFSIFCFIKVLGRQLFEPRLTNKWIVLIAAMVLIVFLATVPEVSSFIYWMATSVTYLFPFAVFLWLICAYAYLLKEQQKHKWGWAIVVCLLTCFLAGCNEIMSFYTGALPFLIAGVLLVSRKAIPAQLYFIIIIAVLASIAIWWVPGSSARANSFARKEDLEASIALGSLHSWVTIQTIFANPIFYVSSFGVLLISMHLKPSVVASFAAKRSNWLLEAGVVLVLYYCLELVLRQVTGKSVPLRAINVIVCLSLLGLWWVLLMNAARIREQLRFIQIHQGLLFKSFIVTFLIVFLGSPFFFQLTRNMIAAPIHAELLNQRIELIGQEKAKGKNIVHITPYQDALAALLQKKFKGKDLFVMENFPCPPSFSFFRDEPNWESRAYFYAEFYGIDTIVGTEGKVARWGLSKYK